jgi:methoxymalonate biosynthesis acyl carrier protein
MTTSIREQVRAFLTKFIAVGNFGDDENIFLSGYVNSLFAMQLVLFVERNFNITVEDMDLDINNFSSINNLTSFIDHKLAASSYQRP